MYLCIILFFEFHLGFNAFFMIMIYLRMQENKKNKTKNNTKTNNYN